MSEYMDKCKKEMLTNMTSYNQQLLNDSLNGIPYDSIESDARATVIKLSDIILSDQRNNIELHLALTQVFQKLGVIREDCVPDITTLIIEVDALMKPEVSVSIKVNAPKLKEDEINNIKLGL